MIQSILRYTSIAVTAVLVLSFVMFVTDQSASGTASEVATLNSENGPTTNGPSTNPTAPAPKAPAKDHGEPRRTIDEVAGDLTRPFEGFAGNSKSKWARKGIPTLAALLIFGFGLSLLAGYVPKPKL